VRSRTPPLDRVALLAISLMLPAVPACVSTSPAEVGRGHSAPAVGPVMPAIAVARTTQSQTDEPPLAADIVVAGPSALTRDLIITAKAESPIGASDGTATANFEKSVTEPRPWSTEQKTPDSVLVDAVRCYVNKSPEQAARRLQALDDSDRRLLAVLLPLAVRLGDGALESSDPQDLAVLVDDVQKLLGPLRERAALDVPKLCFCRPVAAAARFGVYELLDENHLFRPGEMVGIYAEVRNFACKPHGSDYRTQVQTSIEVHNDRGEVVWRFDQAARTDTSLSLRQDYCHVGRFALPGSLPAGAYTLWLKVTDAPTGRTVRRSLDFRVTTVKDVTGGGVGQ
jgi:hypothetical protein